MNGGNTTTASSSTTEHAPYENAGSYQNKKRKWVPDDIAQCDDANDCVIEGVSMSNIHKQQKVDLIEIDDIPLSPPSQMRQQQQLRNLQLNKMNQILKSENKCADGQIFYNDSNTIIELIDDGDSKGAEGGSGVPAKPPSMLYTPIKNLDLFIKDWTIKVRLTKKCQRRFWCSMRSGIEKKGQLMNVEMVDRYGT